MATLRSQAGRAATILALAIVVMTGAASAAGRPEPSATLSEADLPGGAFSADYRAPTRIPAGIDRVRGTGGVGSDDYLLFDLPPGPQTVTLEFRAPEAIGYSYSAGGVVLFDTEAFAYEWAGTQLPVPIRLDHRRRPQSMTITLPESFGGRLFLALNFTHGEGIAYTLSAPAKTPVLTTVEAPSPPRQPVGAGAVPASAAFTGRCWRLPPWARPADRGGICFPSPAQVRPGERQTRLSAYGGHTPRAACPGAAGEIRCRSRFDRDRRRTRCSGSLRTATARRRSRLEVGQCRK